MLSYTMSIDANEVINSLTTMVEQLKDFPVPMANELTNWQTEDMNRKVFTNTTLKGDTAETLIFQHTHPGQVVHYRTKKTHQLRTRLRRPRKRKKGKPWMRPLRIAAIGKPILRPVLYDKLDKRMVELMEEKLQWPR